MVLTKEKITDILLENSEYLASEYGVKRIGLFGKKLPISCWKIRNILPQNTVLRG